MHSTPKNPSADRNRLLHWLNERFEKFSHLVTLWTGSSWAFVVAVTIIIVWALTGPIFHYSDAWQLVINTGTTIVTFLMVFLIQRFQNKESLAVQIKLNELLAALEGASNELINVEDMSEEQIENLHHSFAELSHHLEKVAGDRSAHSIAEAEGALAQFHQHLQAQPTKRPAKRCSRRPQSKPR